MQVGAIVVVGASSVPARGPIEGLAGLEPLTSLGQAPLACRSILGEPVITRVARLLLAAGTDALTLLSGAHASVPPPLPPGLRQASSSANRTHDVWPSIARTIDDYAENGAEMVLLLRLGAYLELDLDDLVRFHRASGQPVTRACDSEGPLDCWMVDAGRIRGGRALFDDQVLQGLPGSYPLTGYVNRLQTGLDLRRLVVDAFLGRCAAKPSGCEVRPGVWVEDSARVRGARIVAPAFVGRGARLRQGSVLTRFSSVESGCDVGCGTVIEDASVLANTFLGAGLDVAHAVVEENQIVDVRRNVTVRIVDATLMGPTGSSDWQYSPAKPADIPFVDAILQPRLEPAQHKERPNSSWSSTPGWGDLRAAFHFVTATDSENT